MMYLHYETKRSLIKIIKYIFFSNYSSPNKRVGVTLYQRIILIISIKQNE